MDSDNRASIKRAILALPIENDVVIGYDGHLFIANGSNNNLAYCAGLVTVEEAKLALLIEDWAEARRRCTERGICYLPIVFPNKETVAWAFHPLCEVVEVPQSIGRSIERLDKHNVVKFFISDDARMFYKTDSHFSPSGTVQCAYWVSAAADNIIASLALEEFAGGIPMRDFTIDGDLGTKLKPKIAEQGKLTMPNADFVTTSNGVHNRGFAELTVNPAAPIDKRLLIFGDSFFRQSRFHYAHWFKSVAMIHTTHFCEDVVDLYRPDIILQGTVERFFANTQSSLWAPCAFTDLPAHYSKERPIVDISPLLRA